MRVETYRYIYPQKNYEHLSRLTLLKQLYIIGAGRNFGFDELIKLKIHFKIYNDKIILLCLKFLTEPG